jgi:hypothetical protein
MIEEEDMIKGEVDVVINRPTDEVFDLWADLSQDPKWHPKAKRVEQTSPGPIRAGTRFYGEYEGMGGMHFETLVYERPRVLRRKGVCASFDFVSTVTLTEGATGTQVHFVGEVHLRGAYKLLAPLMAPMLKKQAATVMGELKRAVESGIRARPR